MSSAPGETLSEPTGVDVSVEVADTDTGGTGSGPLVIIGAAFIAGVALARWLDWREHARAAA